MYTAAIKQKAHTPKAPCYVLCSAAYLSTCLTLTVSICLNVSDDLGVMRSLSCTHTVVEQPIFHLCASPEHSAS